MHNNTITVHTKRHAHTITADRAPRVLDVLSAARDRSGLVFRVDDHADVRIAYAETEALARLKSALDARGVDWRDSTYRNDAGPSVAGAIDDATGEYAWQAWAVYDSDSSVVVDNVLIRCGRVRYSVSGCDTEIDDVDVVAAHIAAL